MSLPFGMGLTTLITWALLSFELTASKDSLTLFQVITAVGLLFYLPRKDELEFSFFPIGFRKFKFHLGWLTLIFLATAGLIFNIFFPIIVSDGVGYKIMGKLMVGEQQVLIHQKWFPFENQNRTLGFHLISGYFYLLGLPKS